MRWGLGAMKGRIQPVRGSGMHKTATVWVRGGRERGGICVAGSPTPQSGGAHGQGRAHGAFSELHPGPQGGQRGNGTRTHGWARVP